MGRNNKVSTAIPDGNGWPFVAGPKHRAPAELLSTAWLLQTPSYGRGTAPESHMVPDTWLGTVLLTLSLGLHASISLG